MEIQLRLRHVSGDLGPWKFVDSTLVSAVKEKIFADWPTEGVMAKEPPTQAADIKLILSGKFLDSAKPLKEYAKDMGEIQPDTIITLHVVIRPSAPAQKPAANGGVTGAPKEQVEAKGCGCIIS